jgi:glycosyltransferase involved in cell wall biosynthesis
VSQFTNSFNGSALDDTPVDGTARLSVAMCTYNGELFLREQIESILQQSSNVDEIIVSDDASTDGTRQILSEYQHKFPKIFRVYFHSDNHGTVKNFEFALGQCRGQLIFLCDQDDVWQTKKVETMRIQFERDPSCLLLFTDGNLIDSFGEPLPIGGTLWKKWNFTLWERWRWKLPGFALTDLSYNNNKVTGATVALRRSLLEHSLPIQLPHGYWHDAWFALHAAAHNGLTFIPERLIDYRIHPNQQVGVTRGVDPLNRDCVSIPTFIDRLKRQYPARAALIGRPVFARGFKTILQRLRSALTSTS